MSDSQITDVSAARPGPMTRSLVAHPRCGRTARFTGIAAVLFCTSILLHPENSRHQGGFLVPATQAQEDKSNDCQNQSNAASKEDQGDQTGDRLAGFARLLRIGQTSRDILIPAVERGSMTSLTKAEALTRRSEDYLDLIELVIQFYNAEGEPDARLYTPYAEFHVPSGILASDHRTLVSRSDFDLEGDRFAFDTKSRRSRFEGNVTMIIHSMERFTNQNTEVEPLESKDHQDDGSAPSPKDTNGTGSEADSQTMQPSDNTSK